MSARLTRERMLDAAEAQAGLVRFALAGERVDLTSPVPTCPGWSVHDLVAHLGTANWWGGANVRAASPDERARGMRAVHESAPDAAGGPGALADWYAGLNAEMITTCAAADPDAPAWTFAGPGLAGYWLRRMLHETTVHRYDLEAALGGADSVTPVPEDVAVDAVDEFCTAMWPVMSAARPAFPVTIRVRAELRTPEGLASGAEPVGSSAPGDDLEWLLTGEVGAPEALVTGPPETLMLLLWGRVGPDADDLEVSGDRAALDEAVAAGLAV